MTKRWRWRPRPWMALALAVMVIAWAPGLLHAKGLAKPAATWVVKPGDTLWGVARSIRPDSDPRVTVERLLTLNHLANPLLQVGQVLLLPAR